MKELGCALVTICLATPVIALAQSIPSATADDLERVRREHQAELDFCLVRERSLHPDAAGTVVVDFSLVAVDGGARAAEATVLSTTFTLAGAVAPECVRAAVMRWRFPAAGEAGQHQQMTFALGNEGAPAPTVVGTERAEPAEPRGARVSWTLLPEAGDEAIAESLGAALEPRRAELVACFGEAALLVGPSGEADLQLEVRVPRSGAPGRRDLSVRTSSWPETARLVRCLSPHIARIRLGRVGGRHRIGWSVRVAWP
jgi:hypothetical protein